MKKLLATMLASSLALSMVACSSDSSGGTQAGGTSSNNNSSGTAPTITIAGYATVETDMNILADQLKKAGFGVNLNVQPDYSSFTALQATGEWDIAMGGWTTVTGNPDYAVRDIFMSDAAYNRQYLSDSNVDALIEQAATETPEQYVATYTELENILVNEQAYIIPMYSSLRMQGVNTELMTPDMRQPKSRSSVWEQYEYIDSSLNETRPFVMTQYLTSLTSLDPIQANDGSINQLSSNINSRIISLSDEDVVEVDGSLSYSYAIAEGNMAYYFLLRDDVNFTKVEGDTAVDTGVRVGAEDVVFSLERAKDQNSVALHQTYVLHSHMDEISIVTDLDELNTILDSDTGATIFETLSNGISNDLATLTADKTEANNKSGTYQVVKVTTPYAFPQVLNYLAHQSAGILSAEQVTMMNSQFDVASYNAATDVCYGDSNAIKNSDNHLWMSGPYALVSYDDYQINFQKNPGYMVGTENEPRIKDIQIKFIADPTSALSAFRSGEVDLLTITNPTHAITIENDANHLAVMKRSSNAVSYASFNLSDSSVFSDVDLRKSALYAIDQQAFIAVNSDLVNNAFSTVSTLIDTGNVHVYDADLSAKHLEAYLAK